MTSQRLRPARALIQVDTLATVAPFVHAVDAITLDDSSRTNHVDHTMFATATKRMIVSHWRLVCDLGLFGARCRTDLFP